MRICGEWSTRRVWIDDKELLPERSLQVISHSPDGFRWGDMGAGPAQLALALLLELTDDAPFAVFYHQALMSRVIARLPQ